MITKVIDGGEGLIPPAKKKKDPFWDIPGIPAPDAADLKWAKKKLSKNKKLWFLARKCLLKRQVWRVIHILEHNSKSPRSDQFSVSHYGHYEIREPGCLMTFARDKLSGQARAAVITALYEAGYSRHNYHGHMTIRSIRTHHAHLKIIAEKHPYLVLNYAVRENKDTNFARKLIKDIGHNEDVIKLFVHNWPDKDLLKQALKITPIVKNDSELYDKASKFEDPEIFHILCQAKYEHEKESGTFFPLPIADEYIARQFTGHKKNNTSASNSFACEWEAHGEHSIYRNHPLEDNGTRLRDHFDFAAGKIVRVQEMPDGAYNPILDWDMREAMGSAAMDQAIETLRQNGGHPEIFSPLANKIKKPGQTTRPAARKAP